MTTQKSVQLQRGGGGSAEWYAVKNALAAISRSLYGWLWLPLYDLSRRGLKLSTTAFTSAALGWVPLHVCLLKTVDRGSTPHVVGIKHTVSRKKSAGLSV